MGKGLPDPAHDLQHGFLVVRVERLPPQQGQPLDVGGDQGGQDLVLLRLSEGLSVAKIPGLFIEAAGAAVGAPGHKQGYPYTGSVGHVGPFDGGKIHKKLLPPCGRKPGRSANRPGFVPITGGAPGRQSPWSSPHSRNSRPDIRRSSG